MPLGRSAKAGNSLAIALGCLVVAASCRAQDSASAGTTSFVLDGNRVYAKLSFVRPDGSLRVAHAFVDMGGPQTFVRESLFEELGLDRGKTLAFRVGQMTVRVPASAVGKDPSKPYSIGPDAKVEALLPAGVLQKYQVVIDYRSRALTLARPGTIEPAGTPVPFRLKKETGLLAVDASIDGKSYPVTIDNGSAYTWFRQSTAEDWLNAHPQWERGVGAVGASNMMMSGDAAEASGILLRIPEIVVGRLRLKNVGVLGAGPGRSPSPDLSLFDWYSTKNAVPVIGWIGGNVLKNFRLTIDYPNRIIYWLKQSDPDAEDLDQVGLTLRSERGEFIVAAVAKKNGKTTVEGVLPGDRLIRVGDLETKGASWGAIYAALHGEPGEIRRLLLERNGKRLTIAAAVTAF